MTRLMGVVLCLVALAGCASSKDSGMNRAMNKTSTGFGDAVTAPLSDLNITRTEVPQRLAELVSPYAPLRNANCRTIGLEVAELTNILGPDVDTDGKSDTLNQKLGEGAADLFLGTLSSTMSDFIPFRSAVREATGASAHERRLKAAYERGINRRAYLKGIGASKGCAPPAAPQPGAGFIPQPQLQSSGG
jgi:hypothetical protein